MKVAIFKVNQLGDNVVFLPVVQTLRKLHPQWQFLLLTSPVAKDLFSSSLRPEEMLVMPTREFNGAWKHPRCLLSLLTQVRRFRPDACLIADDQGYVAHFLARLSGAPHREGIKPAHLKFAPKLTLEVPLPKKRYAASVAWEFGRALVRAFGEGDWPEQPSAPDLSHLTHGQMPVANRVIIHPGASREYKRWPLERFEELAGRLAAHCDVWWIDSAEVERRELPAAVRRIRPSSIAELTQTLASAELFIGNNSGPMNLVFALGRPAVIINGPTTRLWDPFWYPDRALMLRDLSLPCLPCETVVGPVNVCHNRLAPIACMKRWTVDEVEQQCRRWLRRWQGGPACIQKTLSS